MGHDKAQALEAFTRGLPLCKQDQNHAVRLANLVADVLIRSIADLERMGQIKDRHGVFTATIAIATKAICSESDSHGAVVP